MAKKDGKKQILKENNKGIDDERFQGVLSDPRFKIPNLDKTKVQVDSRFSKEELSKLNEGNKTGKKTDRYGRRVKKADDVKQLEKYYKFEGDTKEEASSDEEEEPQGEKDVSRVFLDKARGEGLESSSEEDEKTLSGEFLDKARGEGLASSSEESELDSEEETPVEEESDIEIPQEKVEEGEETSKFAVVNMDWDNLKAVDLMATFMSFVPVGGAIHSVTIYPSEYGRTQMQREEIEGPPKEFFNNGRRKQKQKGSDSEESDGEIDVTRAEGIEKAARALYTEENEEDYDSKSLRRYQLQRLRYFYAVVRCDSVNTARNIYKNCDGTEYESTANVFNLQYVPEDMEFEEKEAKDVCTRVPVNYRPQSFVTDALQHSRVKLTWDQTPSDRVTMANKRFSQKELEEMDFQAYLASESEEEEKGEDLQALKSRYAQLLGGFAPGTAQDNEDDVDMEITFNPALQNNDNNEPKDDEKEETTIEAYKRKEKERRKRRMEKHKQQLDNEKNKHESENQSTDEEQTATPAHQNDDKKANSELELLMMNENGEDDAQHFNMKDIMKAEKQKGKKKSKKDKKAQTLPQDDFKVDLDDPRLREVFESHEYAIDPTSSEFRKSEAMKLILNERSKRARSKNSSEEKSKKKKSSKNYPYKDTGSSAVSLVEKLKRKSSK